MINNKELNIGYMDVENIRIVKILKDKNDYTDFEYQYLINMGNSSGNITYIYDVEGNLIKELVNFHTYHDSYENITLYNNNIYYSYLLFYKCHKGVLSQYAYNFNNKKEIELINLKKVMCSSQED